MKTEGSAKKKRNKKVSNSKLPLLMAVSSLLFFISAAAVILIAVPNDTIAEAYDGWTSEQVWERAYHLEEDGYMLDNGQFVRMSISFELVSSSDISSFQRAKPIIQHTITNALSGKTRSAFYGSTELKKFEDEIRNVLNNTYSDVNIQRVYITGLVIS